MKKYTYLISLLLMTALPLPAASNANSFDKQFQSLKQQLPNAAIGVIIQDPRNGEILYESRSNENFYPASNTKLFTAFGALKFFGPEFQYQTSVHFLKDDLYFVFRGDPSLKVEDLSDLIKQIKEQNITQIKGDIVIDDTAFLDPYYAPGWTWESIPWYYSAPISSIIVNENKVRLKFDKVETLNAQIPITQDQTLLPALKLTSNVHAVTPEDAEKKCQLNVHVVNNDMSLEGCWPLDKTPINVELALDNPRQLSQTLISALLKQHGIEHHGKFVFKPALHNFPVLLVKRSAPLKELLKEVLSESNNVYTESMLKALGVAMLGEGSFQAGLLALQEILTLNTPIDTTKMQLSDGSGQSRYNLVSPYMISQLLYKVYQDPDFSIFYDALSVAGRTGTLTNRMKTEKLAGKIVAKTGSAKGTSTLSGYFTAQNGKVYVFSIMINQAFKENSSLKAFEDKLCELMIEEPWSSKPTPKPLVQAKNRF